MFVAKNGLLYVGSDARQLISGPYDSLCVALLDGVSAVGLGRVLVIGDKDMLVNSYVEAFSENRTFSVNVAAWALGPSPGIHGTCQLAQFVGDSAGLPVELDFYQSGQLVQTVLTSLDGNAGYAARAALAGTYDVAAKVSHWLSVKQTGIGVAIGTTVDWSFPDNGDADGNDFIGLPDMSSVLSGLVAGGLGDADMNGDHIVGFSDLSIVLSNFGQRGER